MKLLKERGEKLFMVVQKANAFEDSYYAGWLRAVNHDDANDKARIEYPDGYLVVEMHQESIAALFR